MSQEPCASCENMAERIRELEEALKKCAEALWGLQFITQDDPNHYVRSSNRRAKEALADPIIRDSIKDSLVQE